LGTHIVQLCESLFCCGWFHGWNCWVMCRWPATLSVVALLLFRIMVHIYSMCLSEVALQIMDKDYMKCLQALSSSQNLFLQQQYQGIGTNQYFDSLRFEYKVQWRTNQKPFIFYIFDHFSQAYTENFLPSCNVTVNKRLFIEEETDCGVHKKQARVTWFTLLWPH